MAPVVIIKYIMKTHLLGRSRRRGDSEAGRVARTSSDVSSNYNSTGSTKYNSLINDTVDPAMCLKLTKLQDGSAEGGRMQITSRNVKKWKIIRNIYNSLHPIGRYSIMTLLLRFNYYFMLFWYQSPSPAKTTA